MASLHGDPRVPSTAAGTHPIRFVSHRTNDAPTEARRLSQSLPFVRPNCATQSTAHLKRARREAGCSTPLRPANTYAVVTAPVAVATFKANGTRVAREAG
jgi:hypothetical protein